jgi:hypothetical protein
MSKIQVGNAPCSWGTLEFEGYNTNSIGYKQMLDELVETGYTATELGDWGFMPTDPQELQKEIDGRKLAMLGAYVQVAFINADAHAAGIEEVLKIARLLATSTPNSKPMIILADDAATIPARTLNAGRATSALSMTAAEWKVYTVCPLFSTTTVPGMLRHPPKSTSSSKILIRPWSIWSLTPVTLSLAADQIPLMPRVRSSLPWNIMVPALPMFTSRTATRVSPLVHVLKNGITSTA